MLMSKSWGVAAVMLHAAGQKIKRVSTQSGVFFGKYEGNVGIHCNRLRILSSKKKYNNINDTWGLCMLAPLQFDFEG